MSLRSIMLVAAMLGGSIPNREISKFEKWSDDKLQAEYNLIQQKKSKLSSAERSELVWYYRNTTHMRR